MPPLKAQERKKKIGPMRVSFLSILMKELGIGECCFVGRTDMIGKPQAQLRPDPGADRKTHRGPPRRNKKRQGRLRPAFPMR